MNLDSRMLIGLCAILILGGATVFATARGGDFILPISIMILLMTVLLIYFTSNQERKTEETGSQLLPYEKTGDSIIEIEQAKETLPNPSDKGFEIPIL